MELEKIRSRINEIDTQLTELFVEENSMHRGSLAGAAWTWEGECLKVKLKANGNQMLQNQYR